MSEAVVARLSFGMATVMREPSAKVRQRLLDLAYERGIRHFDVAPIYGLGAAESALGALIRRGAGDARVTTKHGREVAGLGRAIARVQGPARRLARRVPALGARFRSMGGGAEEAPAPSAPEFIAASERACERLGVDRLEGFLTHEVEWSKGWEAWWRGLDLAAVRADSVGFSGPPALLATYPGGVLASAGAVQTRCAPSEPRPSTVTSVYSVLSVVVPALERLDPGERARLLGGADVPEQDRAGVAVLLAQTLYPGARTIVGTSSAAHLELLLSSMARWGEVEAPAWERLARRIAALDAEGA